MKLSKTKINTYLRCPFQFRLKYIDEIEGEANKYMILGRKVHKVAEIFLKEFKDNLSQINIDYELRKIENNLNYELTYHIDNLSKFFKIVESKYKVIGIEKELVSDELNLTGICDVILENSEGNLIIIDYKTGNSNSFSKHRLELCYYKLLVEEYYNRKVSHVGVFFTKNGRLRLLEIDDNPSIRKYLQPIEIQNAIEIMNDIELKINREEFSPNKQYTCRFCEYYDFCRGI